MQTATTACERCASPLGYDAQICNECGALVHQKRLEQIAYEAVRLEPVNPAAAAMAWRQALDLLPPDSVESMRVRERIGALASGWSGPAGAGHAPARAARAPARGPDPWQRALLKTGLSMVLSIVVYYAFFHSLLFAAGFVVLMLIHEMGHVLATWYFGLSASPPVFIPFVGAVINLREQPPNALVESIIGIGGPVLGTFGALICYALAQAVGGVTGMELMEVAFAGFFLNLFNLLPVPPLDGGRVTAAISPWLWLAGLAGLAAMIVLEVKSRAPSVGLFILIMVLFYALPRIRATLRVRWSQVPYYRISRFASWTMGVLYLGLGGLLAFMFQHLGGWHLLMG